MKRLGVWSAIENLVTLKHFVGARGGVVAVPAYGSNSMPTHEWSNRPTGQIASTFFSIAYLYPNNCEGHNF